MICTERLTLEPVALGHVEGLFALMRVPELSTYLAWEPHTEIAMTSALVESLMRANEVGSGYHWTILEGGRVAGLVSLIDIRRQHRCWNLQRAEVAYWVDVARHGSGIATEAAAFDTFGLHRLIISHTSANPASGRIPQKLGFRFVGTEREFFEKNGTWYDMNHYEILVEDWRSARVEGAG